MICWMLLLLKVIRLWNKSSSIENEIEVGIASPKIKRAKTGLNRNWHISQEVELHVATSLEHLNAFDSFIYVYAILHDNRLRHFTILRIRLKNERKNGKTVHNRKNHNNFLEQLNHLKYIQILFFNFFSFKFHRQK